MLLTIELPDEQTALLAARAREQGMSTEQYVRQVLELDVESSRLHRHISEIIRENMSRVPAEDMAGLPKDGASEHDHYIYGLPKKNP